jgi:hypothetical protein
MTNRTHRDAILYETERRAAVLPGRAGHEGTTAILIGARFSNAVVSAVRRRHSGDLEEG